MPTPSIVISEVDGVLCKKCGTCKKLKPLTEYNADKSKRCGYNSQCRECGKERSIRWYGRNVERERAMTRQWRAENKQKYLAYSKSYMRSIEGGFSYLKYQTKKRGLECNFTLDAYRQIMAVNACHYCSGLLNETGAKLDRKDSSQGYLIANCVPACLKCNLIRGEDNISYEEMLAVAKLLKEMRCLSVRN